MNDLEYKEAKNNQREQEERIQKKRDKDCVSSLWDNFKWFNIHIIRVPEGEEKEQETENLFEKTMKENLPNVVKEIDMQVQEAQSSKQDGCKEAHFNTHHN